MSQLLRTTLVLSCIAICVLAHGQDSSRLDKVISFPDKVFGFLNRKAAKAQGSLDKATDRYLAKLQKREAKLKRKLQKTDSLSAQRIFGDVDTRYAALRNTSGKVSKYSALYSGHLDSLTTSLSFLKDKNLSSSPVLTKTLEQYKSLQEQLNATEQIKAQLRKREAELKQQLANTPLAKAFQSYQKQVYYYQAQVKQYRQAFEDPQKLEEKLLTVLQKLPQFKSFFQKNSLLGSLFALPGGAGDPASTVSLQGLQTRAMVSQALTQQFGSSPNTVQAMQQSLSQAQGQLSELKQKIASYGSGSYGNSGNSSMDMPSFKPNSQKTKPFLQRLEVGTNMQSKRASQFFPVTSDLGLSIGYKLNDKSIIGIGAAYKIGWSRGWGHIHITSEGVGLRSYLDYQMKGSLYLSGGYELNYQSAFDHFDQLRDYSAWQRSGLLGISKRYSVSKKLKGEMKLLWDFLSYQQIPKTQPILFRIGYNLK